MGFILFNPNCFSHFPEVFQGFYNDFLDSRRKPQELHKSNQFTFSKNITKFVYCIPASFLCFQKTIEKLPNFAEFNSKYCNFSKDRKP